MVVEKPSPSKTTYAHISSLIAVGNSAILHFLSFQILHQVVSAMFRFWCMQLRNQNKAWVIESFCDFEILKNKGCAAGGL